jgi:hypothetical protein
MTILPPLARAFVGVVAASLVVAATVVAQQSSATGPRDAPPKQALRVSSLSDLQPRGHDENTLAERFRDASRPIDLLGSGDIIVMQPGEVLAGRDPSADPADVRLRRALCNIVSGVVVGQVVERRVILNASQSALITVDRVAVSQWVYPARNDDTIVLAHKGGRVVVDDRLITTPPNAVLEPHRPSMVFLRNIGLSSTFQDGGAFEIVDGRVSSSLLSGSVEEVTKKIAFVRESCGSDGHR